MGALFSTPSPQPVASLPDPDPVEEVDPDEAEREAREAAQDRRSRGRSGTVFTSWRGVLLERPDLPRRKTLLGE